MGVTVQSSTPPGTGSFSCPRAIASPALNLNANRKEAMMDTGKNDEAAEAEAASPGLVFALNHAVRRGILRVMLNGDGAASSPREVADVLGRPLSNVAYHIRVLADRNAVTLAEVRRVRGTNQHFYRPSNALIASSWAVNALAASEATD
jgi:hypothetical protein